MLIEFLLVRQAGTSTFFILMMISVVDVLGGFIVTLRTAQRDIDDRAGRDRRPILTFVRTVAHEHAISICPAARR